MKQNQPQEWGIMIMYRIYRKQIPALIAILILLGLFLHYEPEAIPWVFGLGIACLLYDMNVHREPSVEREEESP
jgi:hypothetical protein